VLSPAGDNDLSSQITEEGAQIKVLNGSSQADLAAKTAAWLQEQGFDVVAEKNTEHTTVSAVTLQGETPYTLRWLVETFEMETGRITHEYTSGADADLVLILGEDWASNNPMP
jgi:hypothetical protein